ncbi:MAG: dynamin family protein [Nostoc sp. DedQUE12b]|uniref:dynamin family protein n=1 Tax=Nostoc sp. DedQUE12b TaxID=3075398 RepID=UPI002AD46A44|nr:dynamin family protein [Nostoc sp. DedQUE12b]MDZ8086791.1 dynamin family protein [Nostoc sp. DedQUE12b]
MQNVEDEINKALHALKEQKYQVAVIAAMKAGKSTFLNAVIGADVLASETAACTICRTDVRHIPSGQIPRLLEYRDGKRRPLVITEGEAGEIQQKFLMRTREIREKGNPDKTIRFEIEHSIEAISRLSSLAGFTLVDTPGPNEWESGNFNTALKQTALEALRTCNAILFVLNYASYKDNAISDLFKDIIENRKEILSENTGKIYFILNKVDQKTEKDREIADVIEDLKRELTSFGFQNPIIYPASSRQGVLAKLIQQGKATDSQIKDFKKFFSARYAIEDEEGNQIIPAPHKIAPQALKDSGLLTIQETMIQTITQNAGWNLLSDVLLKIDKMAQASEDSLNLQINGWELEINSLKTKVEEYHIRAESAKKKVKNVNESVKAQEKILTTQFSEAMISFASGAKNKIQEEMDRIAKSSSTEYLKTNTQDITELHPQPEIPSHNMNMGLTVPNSIPIFGGFAFSFGVQRPLVEVLSKVNPARFNSHRSTQLKIDDPYKIRVDTEKEAQEIGRTINEFCSPLIQNWWIDTQDQLVRNGTLIREQLVREIQADIQEISNELSKYIGESLQVKLNINPIQFPRFEFQGIDAQVKHQVEVFTRAKTETKYRAETKTEKSGSLCKSDKISTEQVPYQTTIQVEDKYSFYEVDLHETSKLIKQKIDTQVSRSQVVLQQIIHKQVSDDFKSAEQQINNYIKRFQDEFDRLLKERETREAEAEQIRETLNVHKENLNEYLRELTAIRVSLDSWKPLQRIR